MNSLKSISSEELALFDSALELIVSSGTPQELCRRLVHSEFFGGIARGAAIYTLDNNSVFMELAKYGLPAFELSTELTLWSKHPVAGVLHQAAPVYLSQDSELFGPCACIPLNLGGIPYGVIVVRLMDDVISSSVDLGILGLLAKPCAFFLRNIGVPGSRSSGVEEDFKADELTSRQAKILQLMSEGLTNAQIGVKVLMSESTIRQETIRIYRALGVNTRQAAVSKARAIGILPRISTRF